MHLETRVIVTGGAGFLGSHLCERLLKSGANVICVDNFFTGTRRNIDHIVDHRRFDLIRHDVTFPLYVEADQIYSLAERVLQTRHMNSDCGQFTELSLLKSLTKLCSFCQRHIRGPAAGLVAVAKLKTIW